MAVVSFTLSEEGVTAFRDALTCLNKFSDDVSLEARKDKVSREATPNEHALANYRCFGRKLLLTALNMSRSAYACFTFSTARFFSRYAFHGTATMRDRFYCTLYIRVRPVPAAEVPWGGG